MSEEEIQVTPVAEWKQNRMGKLVALPSGRVVKVRASFDMVSALGKGLVPNPLANVFRDQMRGDQSSKAQLTEPSALEAMSVFMKQTVCHHVIEPKFYMVPEGEDDETWEPDDGVSIVDMGADDVSFLFSVVQGGTTDYEKFRQQQIQRVATLANVKNVADAPVPSPAPGS